MIQWGKRDTEFSRFFRYFQAVEVPEKPLWSEWVDVRTGKKIWVAFNNICGPLKEKVKWLEDSHIEGGTDYYEHNSYILLDQYDRVAILVSENDYRLTGFVNISQMASEKVREEFQDVLED